MEIIFQSRKGFPYLAMAYIHRTFPMFSLARSGADMLQMESRIWQQASKNSWRNALMIRRLGSPWVKALTHFHIIPYQCLRGSHPSGSLSSLCSRLLAIVLFLQNTSADCLDNRHINISAPCNSDTRHMFRVFQKSRSLNFSVILPRTATRPLQGCFDWQVAGPKRMAFSKLIHANWLEATSLLLMSLASKNGKPSVVGGGFQQGVWKNRCYTVVDHC